jgi:4-hydroxybenzoate polyprenyltransferase
MHGTRIPSGLLSARFVLFFWIASSVLFILAASRLNRLTLLCSPVALAIVLLYSYTKRITRFSHLFLGLALGIAPTAAWIAVRGSLDPRILVLTLAVLFWTGGFDVLYACQDFEFDRSAGLNSIPQAFGIDGAFWIARGMHVLMLLCLIRLGLLFSFGPVAWCGIGVVAALLLYEHLIVSPRDLRRMNAAFFTLNGIISMLFFVFIAASLLLRR